MDHQKRHPVAIQRQSDIQYTGLAEQIVHLVEDASLANVIEAIAIRCTLIDGIRISGDDNKAVGIGDADVLHRGRVADDAIHRVGQVIAAAQRIDNRSVERRIKIQIRTRGSSGSRQRRMRTKPRLHRLTRRQQYFMRKNVVRSRRLINALPQQLGQKHRRQHKHDGERKAGCRQDELGSQAHRLSGRDA